MHLKPKTIQSSKLQNHRENFPCKPSILSWMISVVSFFLFLLLCKAGYGTNDDIVMISIVSGAFAKASEFIVHSNLLLGIFYKFLFQFTTSFNFVVLFYVLIDFLSIWSLLYLIISQRIPWYFKACFVMTIILLNGYFLTDITFTAISAISATAGLALILFTSFSARKLVVFSTVFGILLVFASILIRPVATLMIVVVYLPFLIINYRILLKRRTVISTLVIIILAAGATFFNQTYVKTSPAWNTFYAYNNSHAQLINTPHYLNSATVFPKVGWTQNDYKLMGEWFFAVPDTFSISRMDALVAQSSGIASFSFVKSDLRNRVTNPTFFPYVVFLIFGLLNAVFVSKKPLHLITEFSVFMAPLIIIVALDFFQKLVAYVIVPSLFAAIFLEIIFIAQVIQKDEIRVTKNHLRKPVNGCLIAGVILAFISGVGFSTDQIIQSSKINGYHQVTYKNELAQLRNFYNQGILPKNSQLFQLTSTGVSYDWVNPWKLDFPGKEFHLTGWLTFSPLFNDSIKELDANSLADALVQNKNVYLITSPQVAKDLETFYAEHDRISVKSSLIAEILDTDTWIIKFEPTQ